MATIHLPTFPADQISRYVIDLDGATYGVELRWNGFDEHWYLTLSDVDGVVLLEGRRIVPEWPLTLHAIDRRLPPGRIFALSAGRSDLQLVYVEADA